MKNENTRDISSDGVLEANITKGHDLHKLACLYLAYWAVHNYCCDPFTQHTPEALFHASSFLVNSTYIGNMPCGMSQVKILYTLAKQATALGAHKVARFAYVALRKLKVPSKWESRVDLDALKNGAKYENGRQSITFAGFSKCLVLDGFW